MHSDLGAQENKICHCSSFSPSICHEVMGLGAMTLVFWMLSFKPAFSFSSFTLLLHCGLSVIYVSSQLSACSLHPGDSLCNGSLVSWNSFTYPLFWFTSLFWWSQLSDNVLRIKTLEKWNVIFEIDFHLPVVVQLLSCIWLFETPWTVAHQISLSFTTSWSLFNLMSVESVMPSNHLILVHPLLLLPSIFPSIRVFSSESSSHIRWLKYWSFSFSISPSSEYSGLISFRIDWFDFLAVQGSLKSLLQNHSLKASVLRCSAFFMVHTWLYGLYLTIVPTLDWELRQI